MYKVVCYKAALLWASSMLAHTFLLTKRIDVLQFSIAILLSTTLLAHTFL